MKNIFVIIDNKMFKEIKHTPNIMILDLVTWNTITFVANGISVPGTKLTEYTATTIKRILYLQTL